MKFTNTRIESDNSAQNTQSSVERKIVLSKNPRDPAYALLFVAFGLWVTVEFLYKTNMFGQMSKVVGPFLILGGILLVFTSPRSVRQMGALLLLVGSGLSCYMFFTLEGMVQSLVIVYPAVNAMAALLVSIVCLLISLAQLCKAM